MKTAKITYAWAIHLSFNFIFFPGFFVQNTTGVIAIEPERFNIVFGNIPKLIFSGTLASIAIIWLNFNNLNKT